MIKFRYVTVAVVMIMSIFLSWAVLGEMKQLEGASPKEAINVILISLDTLRADYVGIYGNPEPLTPFLDELLSENVWFRDCIVQAPWTLASHMSLLTSQYPNVHNVNLAEAKLAEGKKTLAHYLSEYGYYTKGIISNPFLSHGFGFHRGFDAYNDAGKKHGYQSTQQFVQWVEGAHNKNQPFFLFLHYNDPHMPYQAPTPFYNLFDREYEGSVSGSRNDIVKYVRRPIEERDLQHIRNLYGDEVRYLDNQLYQVFCILKELGLYEDSLIIMTADHGEEFKEHGKLEHNQTLYEELIRSPLVIKFPEKMNIRPRMISRQVKNIDLLPTILDVVGAPIPEDSVQGQSLLPLILEEPGTENFNHMIFSESANTHKVSIRSENWKYIYDRRYDQEELYNLETDPEERQNLISSEPELAAELSELVNNYMMQAQSGWHLRTRYPFNIRGVLRTTGRFTPVKAFTIEEDDSLEVSGDQKEIFFNFKSEKRADTLDGIDFNLLPSDAALELEILDAGDLSISSALSRIYIGSRYAKPSKHPVPLTGERLTADPLVDITDLIIITKSRRGKIPGLYIWKLRDREQKIQWADIDQNTRQRLESLGYFR